MILGEGMTVNDDPPAVYATAGRSIEVIGGQPPACAVAVGIDRVGDGHLFEGREQIAMLCSGDGLAEHADHLRRTDGRASEMRSRSRQDWSDRCTSVKRSPWAAADPDLPPPAPRSTNAKPTATSAPVRGPAT